MATNSLAKISWQESIQTENENGPFARKGIAHHLWHKQLNYNEHYKTHTLTKQFTTSILLPTWSMANRAVTASLVFTRSTFQGDNCFLFATSAMCLCGHYVLRTCTTRNMVIHYMVYTSGVVLKARISVICFKHWYNESVSSSWEKFFLILPYSTWK